MTRTLVNLAVPNHQSAPTPPLELVGTAPLPDGLTLEETRKLLSDDARRIVAALTSSLPQGTLDRVFARLAQQQCTDLIVRIDP